MKIEFPSWQSMRAASVVAVVACTAVAVIAENRWLGIFSAWLAGLNLASVLYQTIYMRMSERFGEMVALNNEMSSLNRALIHDKVVFHLSAEMEVDDTERPKLH